MLSNFLNNPISSQTQTSAKQEQFLRVHLVPDTNIILSINQITEVLNIPVEKIVPIPQMPAWTMGVYNWRGEVLWMVDLGHLVGLTPWHKQRYASSNYRAIVIHHGDRKLNENAGEKLGLIVHQVEDLEWCNPDQIQSPPAASVTPELVPFLRGYWLKTNGEILIVIDAETIMAAMPKL
ncbi:chemotaxis protein CheW [Gloeocapsa sp. PCC 73106]|uniref:chemotaxis protein CheW n=1 Tax=Gloeocapsa sp. PCC 73106 TaxID=102232 RepID=UPI0002ACA753|nr:chemotaxis protein CheW [Gloeocapsa sp. PCC 73106]ELR98128.1 chemotaxis signal transduction protein [Gloeocapsa sp. PCC 73106]